MPEAVTTPNPPTGSTPKLLTPGGPHKPGEQGPLLIAGELHDPRRLELLPDPLALLQVVDEHELHPNVLAVGHLFTHGQGHAHLGAGCPKLEGWEEQAASLSRAMGQS